MRQDSFIILSIIAAISIIAIAPTRVLAAPSINFVEPTDNSSDNVTRAYLIMNVTASDANLQNITISVYDSAGSPINSTNTTQPNLYSNVSVPDEGLYYFNASACNTTGGCNDTETRNVTVDLNPPNLNLTGPANNKIFNYSVMQFNYTVNDIATAISNCSLYLDSGLNETNNSVQEGGVQSFTGRNLSDGWHNWSVACFDSVGHENATGTRWLYIDTVPPNSTLQKPGDNEAINAKSQNYVYQVNASVDDSSNVTAYFQYRYNSTEPWFSVCNSSGAGPDYTCNWNLAGLANGSQYQLKVYSIDDAGNLESSDTNENISIENYPELKVESTGIMFNTTSPAEGETIIINATIYNDGGVNASNVTVRFFNGDPDAGGVQIGSNSSINLSNYAGGQNRTTVNVSWQVPGPGPFMIYVDVDPPTGTGGVIMEENESNNKANKTIHAPGYHYFYGSIFSSIYLANEQNLSLYVYANNSNAAGNVLATSQNNSISFSALQAIGRDTSNQTTSDDFTDVDAALNMTGFEDSINNLFAGGTNSPLETMSVVLFNVTLSNVSSINSTNTTNFKTGMLWDTSDGGTEYDGSQDLIFVTKINPEQQGAYGTYDYELRVPVRLQGYKQSSAVVFYWEITSG